MRFKMPSPIVESRNKDYEVNDQQQQQQKSSNNGFIRNSNGENGSGDPESLGVLLEDGQLNNGPTARPMVVNFGPGTTTRTSISRLNPPQNRLIILAISFMVLGAAIGALTIYFASNQTCLQGKIFLIIFLDNLL